MRSLFGTLENFAILRDKTHVCQSCKTYIKTVDLTVDGRAVPIVEEIAMLPLDLWAVEQGYNKIQLNLVGM